MLGVLLSTQAWQPARLAVGRLARRLTMSAGVVTETVEIDGQTMEVERFVEADDPATGSSASSSAGPKSDATSKACCLLS